MRFKILHQDKNTIAIHKPSGFVTYADTPGVKGAKELLEKQTGKRLFPVHRIDKDTCGVLVFALSEAASRTLTELFRSRVVKKQYLAVVHGLAPARGVIDSPLEKHKGSGTEPAHTEFARLGFTEVDWDGEKRAYSLVRCEMKTGRYHQVRRHLRSIGHPLCGDPEHGNAWDNRAFKERFGVERTLLCAERVAFPDREKQQMVRLKTSPDPDFQKVMSAFKFGV